MDNKINKGDTFVKKMFADSYYVIYVEYEDRRDNKDCYFGTINIIDDSGVLTHFNVDITRDLEESTPIPKSFYWEIVGLIDKALLDAASVVSRVKHEKLKHLKEGSCYAFFDRCGRLCLNKVKYFEAVDDDDAPGIYEVETLDEEGGEVHNETYCIGTRYFEEESTYILRESLGEDEDFIISKKAYNKIVQLHTKFVSNLMELLDANASLMGLEKR